MIEIGLFVSVLTGILFIVVWLGQPTTEQAQAVILERTTKYCAVEIEGGIRTDLQGNCQGHITGDNLTVIKVNGGWWIAK